MPVILISYASWNGGLFNYLGKILANDSVITLGDNSRVFNYNDVTGGSNFAANQRSELLATSP